MEITKTNDAEFLRSNHLKRISYGEEEYLSILFGLRATLAILAF